MKIDFWNSGSVNATSIIPFLSPVQNKGVIAGGILFVIFVFGACLIQRIITIRNSKNSLKERIMKITDANFADEFEEVRPSKYGDIRFTIDYSYERGALRVGDISLSDLHSSTGSEIDSYVIVRIEPDQWKLKPRKTNIIQKTSCPNFTKKFNFKIPVLELNRVTVVVEIYDNDVAGSSDQMLGSARFEVSSLTQDEMAEFPIERKMPICAPIDNDEGYGEICIVLRHIPLQHILSVTILEAKRLHMKKKKTFPPVFVTITMYHKGEVIKEQGTTVKHDCRDPFFSETFRFHLKPVKTPYTYVIIKAMTKTVLGIHKCIGKLEIGCDSKTISGRNHWKSMVASPRIAVASWHMLSKNI